MYRFMTLEVVLTLGLSVDFTDMIMPNPPPQSVFFHLIRIAILRSPPGDAGDFDHNHFADVKRFRGFAGEQIKDFFGLRRSIRGSQVFVSIIQLGSYVIQRDAFVAVTLRTDEKEGGQMRKKYS